MVSSCENPSRSLCRAQPFKIHQVCYFFSSVSTENDVPIDTALNAEEAMILASRNLIGMFSIHLRVIFLSPREPPLHTKN